MTPENETNRPSNGVDEAGGGSVETDHLLLGMLQVRRALATELLGRLGVSPEAVQGRVRAYRAQAS